MPTQPSSQSERINDVWSASRRLLRRHPGVNSPLLLGVLFAAQSVINTRQAIVRDGCQWIEADALFDLFGRLRIGMAAFVGKAQLEVRLPSVGLELDGF